MYFPDHHVWQFKWLILISAVMSIILSAGELSAKEYIGRDVCKSCHQEQDQHWQGSHHDLAMQKATDKTVLGDFDDVEFRHFDVTTRFSRKGGKFMVRTDGPDGKLQDYVIAYTFGVFPLQQYLVPFSEGRLQVLDIAWDSRSKQAGGQRWFHLHPEDKVAFDDVLHWTGPNLNWNYMCADCHSTDLKKNLNIKTGRYDTRWSEIDVSCEACHGPGDEHRKWAQSTDNKDKAVNNGLTVILNERDGISWPIDMETGKPVRSKPNLSRTEVDVCARCHSRRSQLSDDFVPGQAFLDAYHPALLNEGLYYPDGQMLDEVYVWGSFQQSKMYHAGITCSDCHDPHTARLKAPGEQVCYRCHTAEKYTDRKHHFHTENSPGSNCVECHMPPTTFMGVDKRHDHSFRIPRPDLSVSLGTPNACNQCHTDKSAEWSAAQVKTWYGSIPHGFQDFAPALNADWHNQPDAYSLLVRLAVTDEQPIIARATAMSQLSAYGGQQILMLLQQNLKADDPLIRLGALQSLELLPQQQRILALPLVWDEIKAIRILAARLTAAYPRDQLKPEQAEVLDKVLQEYIQSQEFNGERAESQLNLGSLYTDVREFTTAEQAYRKALQLQPQFIPAYINFAQMLSDRGREGEANNLLNAGIKQVPSSADLYHALGLSQIRQKDVASAVLSLEKAASLGVENSRYQYVYAVALQSSGKLEESLEVLRKTHDRVPYDIDILLALVTFNREAGKQEEALSYAVKLQALLPANPDINQLVEQLQGK